MEIHLDNASRAFPAPGTTLYDLINNPEFKKKFYSRLKPTNRLMVPLYKLGVLPLFGMGKRIMLLTTIGRKSDTLRDFPVGYFRIDDVIYVFSAWGREANWYKNLIANPDQVFVQIGFRRIRVHPQVVEDPEELKQIIRRFVLQDPAGAQMLMGWDPERDGLATADFSIMIAQVLTVRFNEGSGEALR